MGQIMRVEIVRSWGEGNRWSVISPIAIKRTGSVSLSSGPQLTSAGTPASPRKGPSPVNITLMEWRHRIIRPSLLGGTEGE